MKRPIEICPELSKLLQVINLMEMVPGELIALQYDLHKSFFKSIIKAACIAGGVHIDRLKEEIYCLLKNRVNKNKSMLYWFTRNLSVDCVWERTDGLVPAAHILKGLCSKSDILGIPSALIALANSQAESEEERKDYLEKMIDDPDSTLRGHAMACWLGDDTFLSSR